ncbi:phosphoenolpyruvate carboxykinase (ATP) [Hanstruepera ponticola]|uniref:hypothetical protein n=1 Tax=Hanstruepera ponticola TaxID=2042995 RepID=UPI000CF161B2|nr:hypothetical protein [Hanstruepera ponticola]
MNNYIAPELVKTINGVNILWFESSNKYILMDDTNLSLLNYFLDSSNRQEFTKRLTKSLFISEETSYSVYEDLKQLLLQCNSLPNEALKSEIPLETFQFTETVTYQIKNKLLEVCFSNDLIKQLIHPQFKHLEHKTTQKADFTFHVASKDNLLYLFTNRIHCEPFKKSDTHLLQGKFAMELLCLITNRHEDDWLGTFHASTISNDKEAVMLLGESGKGKSTLSAILMHNGFNLIADDFTPVLAKTQSIYAYPSAISIKEGSFKVIENYIDDFNDIKAIKNHTTKGKIKYITPLNKLGLNNIPCYKMVLVNYQKDVPTTIEKAPIESVLETLIPDSWLSPKTENAKLFLNWLEKITFYKLTYSNNNEVIDIFKNELLTN